MPRSETVAAHHFDALGTTCSVFAAGGTPERLLDAGRWVGGMGARLTRFSSDSELSRLNAGGGRWVEVSPELESLLRDSLHAFAQSCGLVNVAVLGSMTAIGYTRPLGEGPLAGVDREPSPLRPLPDVLSVRQGRARVERGAGIDLGGIAKGWMADQVCRRLGPNALANLGGDLCAGGGGPQGGGWPVGFAGVTLLLRDQAAATSSTRRRRWGGYHHLIDPRTGRPSRTGLEEVSVVAETAIRAEVVAKTALLLGPGLADAYCARNALAWWLAA